MFERRRIPALAGVVGLMFGACFLGAPAAHAAEGPAFDGTASAYGIDATVENASIPLGLVPEVAGPTSQAHLDSAGSSDAFASFPYPGETVAALPDTAGGLFGLPVPSYPLIAATGAGEAPKDVGVPGVELHAESGAGAATGRAVIGTAGNGFTSTARVETLSDGSVRASAETNLGVNLLGLVSVSGIDAEAQVTADAFSGKLTRTSHLSIGEISVGGLALTVPATTPGTIPIPIPVPGLPQLPPINLPTLPLPLAGTLTAPNLGFEDGTFTVTLLSLLGKPVKFAIPAGIVLKALKVLGIDVTYQTAQETSTGIIAPVLTFTMTAPALPKNELYNGTTKVSFSVGRASANVTLHPVEAAAAQPPPVLSDGGGDTTGTTPVLPATTGAGTGGGVMQPTVPTVIGSAGAPPASSDTGGGGGNTAVPNTAPAAPPSSYGLPVADLSKLDLSVLYLICVIVAGLALVAGTVVRLIGVRLIWAS